MWFFLENFRIEYSFEIEYPRIWIVKLYFFINILIELFSIKFYELYQIFKSIINIVCNLYEDIPIHHWKNFQ